MVLEYSLHGDEKQIPQPETTLVGVELALGDLLPHSLVLVQQTIQQLHSLGQLRAKVAVSQKSLLELQENFA